MTTTGAVCAAPTSSVRVQPDPREDGSTQRPGRGGCCQADCQVAARRTHRGKEGGGIPELPDAHVTEKQGTGSG